MTLQNAFENLAVESKQDTINTSTQAVKTSVDGVNTTLGTTNSTLTAANTKLDTLNTTLDTPRQEDGHGSAVGDPSYVTDVQTAGQILADQAGADGVLTFTFSSTMDEVFVHSAGAATRADPLGGTPAASTGIPCPSGTIVAMRVRTSSVKIYASSSATAVSVWGFKH